jgi:hypothetical protein
MYRCELDNLARIHDKNPIEVNDRIQTMCDSEDCDAVESTSNNALDALVGRHVDIRCEKVRRKKHCD